MAEGDTHHRQRRIMNPCFGNTQIRDIVPVFYAKSVEASNLRGKSAVCSLICALSRNHKLRDAWLNKLSESPSGEVRIDVLEWLSRATLDIIGLAGFNYNFNAIAAGETNELAQAFKTVMTPSRRVCPVSRSEMLLELRLIIFKR